MATQSTSRHWSQRLLGVERRNWRPALLFVLPAFVLLLSITIYPLVRTLALSFVTLELSVSPVERFNGLGNFTKALTADPRFGNAMLNTAILAVIGVTIQVVLGMALALMASEMGRTRAVWVTLFMIPIMIAPVVSGFQFRVIFNDTFGPLNYLIREVSNGTIRPPPWTASTSTSLLTIMITDIWQWTPFMLLLLLAGLDSLSQEVIEAARVDGANYWQQLIRIKIPILLPILIIGILIRMMDTFKTFDLVVLLTEGGPGSSSETVAYYTYVNGFKFFSMGYTAALAFIQLVVIVVVSRGFLSLQQRQRGDLR
ncbi:MAG: sugar ABC transporter permease [Anaerolineae bacterium]|nr:sugar ABC transporter permease [Anaerolineae bacterium]